MLTEVPSRTPPRPRRLPPTRKVANRLLQWAAVPRAARPCETLYARDAGWRP